MGLSVGYMGTKKHLAPIVSDVIKLCPDGIALDAFSGMCSVSEAIGSSRIVWNNDAQIFSSEVAKAFFTSSSLPPTVSEITGNLYDHYIKNKTSLQKRFELRLSEEEKHLKSADLDSYRNHQNGAIHVGNDEELNNERKEIDIRNHFPYRLFSLTFSDGYFSLQQSIDIDSIKYAIDQVKIKKIFNEDQCRWLIIALCHATVKIATTTGHFAQYLKPNSNNFSNILKQRSRSVWENFINCLIELSPIGTKTWRKNNKVFNEDSLIFLTKSLDFKEKPSVIYADPPYTDDQYSRYYHVWETLCLYDYPTSFGIGRYRPDRFRTPFSIKTLVKKSMDEFVSHSKKLGSQLILSYPDNGLLVKAGGSVVEILKNHYSHVETVHSIEYEHSTMGASKGAAKHAVRELIYWAK